MYMRKKCDEEKEGERGEQERGGEKRPGKKAVREDIKEVLTMDSKSFCYRMPSLSTLIY